MSDWRGIREHEPRSLLALAIERKEWEVAALCLLLGVSRAAQSLPPDGVEALLDVLTDAPGPRRASRSRRRGSCHERGG